MAQRSSKDLAKRLRFDRFPRPDRFRRSYAVLSAAAVLAAVGVWVVFGRAIRDRQYLPGPMSPAHATFGDRCAVCHEPFASVRDDACLKCHETRVHSAFEVHTPRCASCHPEHRHTARLLAVDNASCVDCHGRLETKRSTPVIEPAVAAFAAHPPFTPLRAGRIDRAAVRFNHRIHLTSDKIAKADTLSCASCHQVNGAGARMRPIRFEPHCQRCHKQEVQGPTGSLEAVHKSPDAVRADLIAQLSVVGIRDAEAIFAPPARPLPGVRAAPIDESRALQQYQERWLERLETVLYKPLDEPAGSPPPRLLESNKHCFLCHIQGDETEGQPAIAKTRIPKRWLPRADFSHRAHELMACTECHASAETSQRTSDINLPAKERCLRCHVDEATASAGSACVLCHLYHDTSKSAALRARRRTPQTIDVLTGTPPRGDPVPH
jgi:hypothetical protein